MKTLGLSHLQKFFEFFIFGSKAVLSYFFQLQNLFLKKRAFSYDFAMSLISHHHFVLLETNPITQLYYQN
jgi:hypothetical protein